MDAKLPGQFATDRLRGNFAAIAQQQSSTAEDVAERKRAGIPARRFGEPDEFSAACAFLCSAQATYITGQNLLIDGGSWQLSRYLLEVACAHAVAFHATGPVACNRCWCWC